MQSFDPRVNRIKPIEEKTEMNIGEAWEPYEVFHQKKRGDHHIHVGSVHAPNAAQALLFAKEQYGRRQNCVNMWVVKTADVTQFQYDDADIFETAYGFKVRDKINAYKKANP